jgi:hypothetical protein
MARLISFIINEETEKLLLELAADWKKDPIELAKALFIEELTANLAGSQGIPNSRRYLYRDANVYFTKEELEERDRAMEAYWQSTEGQAAQTEQQLLLDQMTANIAKMSTPKPGNP